MYDVWLAAISLLCKKLLILVLLREDPLYEIAGAGIASIGNNSKNFVTLVFSSNMMIEIQKQVLKPVLPRSRYIYSLGSVMSSFWLKKKRGLHALQIEVILRISPKCKFHFLTDAIILG